MSHDIPKHRERPGDEYISQTKYVDNIVAMRSGLAAGVSPALKNIRHFDASASEWGEDHLTRFQAIVLEQQLFLNIYPIKHAPMYDDPVLVALRQDAFFDTTANDVKRGEWKTKTYHNNFFIDLMHLLVGADPPTLSIPTTRTAPERESKTSARAAIERLLANEDTLRPDSPVDGRLSPMSLFSSDTAATKSLKFWGPRETSSHSLFHNLLKSIACLEYDHGTQGDKYWLPA